MFDREAYEKRIQWHQHDRFGMFLHWGLYSIPARGEWVRGTEHYKPEDYVSFMNEFNPVDYNPKEWARMAKEAGMKYVVLTAKHHDGFCLWDTKTTDFKATNTPCGRDLVREYVDAVREAGLKVGLYYSIIDWNHEDYPHYNDPYHPQSGNPDYPDDHRDFNRYLDYMHAQVKELCSEYGKLDILWFDFSYGNMRGEIWRATDLIRMVRSYQPDVIIDNRLEGDGTSLGSLATGNPTEYHGDFLSPEQIIPPNGLRDYRGEPIAWEACVTMNNNWGYCGIDTEYKPASMLIRKLVECVSKGGNLLLNVGPDAKGNFPIQSVGILKEIGAWMRKNSDSIYGCGMSGMEKPEYGRLTRNGKKLYLHIYENSVGPLPLVGFKREDIKKIRMLSDGREIFISNSWVCSLYTDIVFADLGSNPILPDPVDTVLEIELSDESQL